jgi:hypothetical protein
MIMPLLYSYSVMFLCMGRMEKLVPPWGEGEEGGHLGGTFTGEAILKWIVYGFGGKPQNKHHTYSVRFDGSGFPVTVCPHLVSFIGVPRSWIIFFSAYYYYRILWVYL